MSGSEAGPGVATGPAARTGRRALLAVALDGLAVVWSLALVAALYSVRVPEQVLFVRGTVGHTVRWTVTKTHTLAQSGGPGVVIFVVAMVMLALVVTAVHVAGFRRGIGWGNSAAWVGAAISCVMVFLGAFTVGPYAFPVAALLVAGCALVSTARSARAATPSFRRPGRPPRS
jgi:hypothetical protein